MCSDDDRYCRVHDLFDCWFAHDPEDRFECAEFAECGAIADGAGCKLSVVRGAGVVCDVHGTFVASMADVRKV